MRVDPKMVSSPENTHADYNIMIHGGNHQVVEMAWCDNLIYASSNDFLTLYLSTMHASI